MIKVQIKPYALSTYFRTSIPHPLFKMNAHFIKSRMFTKIKNPCHSKGFGTCAREETRTPTSFTSQASETCASTNFATRAKFFKKVEMYCLPTADCQLPTFLTCPERDSNSYTCYGATPSKWCVCQFRHLGILE